jgi:hypothetical protein
VSTSRATALVAATALHAGFQLSVSCLVYPALGMVPEQDWRRLHDLHGRRITPLVGLVYAGVLAGATLALAEDRSPAALTSVAASATALGLTALAAAPLHARLGPRRDASLFARLLRVDRLRSGSALVALAAAVAAARS